MSKYSRVTRGQVELQFSSVQLERRANPWCGSFTCRPRRWMCRAEAGQRLTPSRLLSPYRLVRAERWHRSAGGEQRQSARDSHAAGGDLQDA